MISYRIQGKNGISWIDYSLMGPGFFYFRAGESMKKEEKMGKSRFAFVLVVGILLTGFVLPNQATTNQYPVLEEVVVTASRVEEKKKHVTATLCWT